MTEAPEKIWTTGNKTTGSWNSTPTSLRLSPVQVEYTRSNIADTLRAEVARLRAAVEMLRNLVWPHPSEDTEKYREQIEACDFADEVLSHGEADQ